MFRPIRTLHALRRYTTALPLSDAQRSTIYALSTPPAKSGVAVIRVSGPDALHVWQRMVRSTRTGAHANRPTRERKDGETSRQLLPEAWKLQRCHVVDPQSSELLDDALAVFFRGAHPASSSASCRKP